MSVEVEHIPSHELLADTLRKYGIDFSTWGTGEAKTLRSLAKEVEEGETQLVEVEGKLLRRVSVTSVDVFYTTPEGKKLRLREDRQEFFDGRVRRRDLGGAVQEKMLPHEDFNATAVRALKEELQLEGNFALTAGTPTETRISSPSYPGLESQYLKCEFTVELTAEQFNPKGYEEPQDDKTTYFVWKQVS